jgi:hypothetical protein
VGSARRRAAGHSGRTDDRRPACGKPKLGSARSLTGEALCRIVAVVGCARITSGRSGADLGLAPGTRRPGKQLSGSASDLGIAIGSGGAGAELGSTTAWAAFDRTFMGRSRSFRFSRSRPAATVSPILGSPCRPAAIVGVAARRRAKAGRAPGDIVEPAGSILGRAEARRAPGSAFVQRAGLGSPTGRVSASTDRRAVLGRAVPSRVGCPKD